MAEELLEKLKGTDVALLTKLVRQDQHSPDFVVLDWAVEPFSKKGFGGAEGLFLFHGQGRLGDVEQPWSLVLKILKQPAEEHPPSDYFWLSRTCRGSESGSSASERPGRVLPVFRPSRPRITFGAWLCDGLK